MMVQECVDAIVTGSRFSKEGRSAGFIAGANVRPGLILVGMVLLQVVWLVAIGWTGAAANGEKIPVLLVYTLVTGLSVGLMPKEWMHRTVNIFQGRGGLGLGVVAAVVGISYCFIQEVEILVNERAVSQASMMVAEGGGAFFLGNYGADDFIFDQEIVAQVVEQGFKVAEVSVPVRYFPEASSVRFGGVCCMASRFCGYC
jgi:hypothetical protein